MGKSRNVRRSFSLRWTETCWNTLVWCPGDCYFEALYSDFSCKWTIEKALYLWATLWKWIESRAHAKVLALKSNLAKLDSQSAYIILRNCASFCKIAFFLRAVPPDVVAKVITSFDCLVASLFRSFFQFRLEANSISQLQLSVSFGGIGLRSARYHHHAAFYASLGSALPLVGKVIGRFPSFSYEFLDSIRADLVLYFPSDFQLSCYDQGKISRAWISTVPRPPLHLISSGKARLLAAARPKAGSFLNVVPNAALGTVLQSAEFNVAIAYRIGSPILPNPLLVQLETVIRLSTSMVITLRAANLKEISRTDIIAFVIWSTRSANRRCCNRCWNLLVPVVDNRVLNPILTAPQLARTADQDPNQNAQCPICIGMLRDCGLKPADVAIPDWACPSPLTKLWLILRLDVVPRSSSESFSAANDYAVNVKHRKYSRMIRDGEIRYVVVLTCLGNANNRCENESRPTMQKQSESLAHQSIQVSENYVHLNFVLTRHSFSPVNLVISLLMKLFRNDWIGKRIMIIFDREEGIEREGILKVPLTILHG